jgi:hypothetical protein
MKAYYIGAIIFLVIVLGASFSLFRKFHRAEPFLATALAALANERRQLGYYGRHALVLKAVKNENYLILANIEGEAGALQRIISDLQSKKILSSDLHILDEHTSLVINGNSMGGPSDLEVLKTIMELMQKNARVYYIRGVQEDKEYWVDNSLGKKLAELFPDFDYVRKKVRDFFNTLPLALYIVSEDEKKVLRISYLSVSEEFQRINCKATDQQSVIKAICTLGDLCSIKEDSLTATIVGQVEGVNWETMQGLQAVGMPPVWHIVSSSTVDLKGTERYAYDAYALLELDPTLVSSTITLYHLRENEPLPFIFGGSFNLASATALTQP